MALLNFEDELGRARDAVPFSNGFEFESWSSIWCEECRHEQTCPLLLVILHEKTPAVWEDKDPMALNRYHCHEFSQKDIDETQEVQNQGAA